MTPATPRQAISLSALAVRRANNGGKAMLAEAWADTDLAEAILSRTESWRAYRRDHPRRGPGSRQPAPL